MIEVTDIETAGWGPALRGMRNPLNSWDKADSTYAQVTWLEGVTPQIYELGPNDESLMRRLIRQGSSDHCKFRRMLSIYADVNAPWYWWKEFDTYKVGTVSNSCSSMHTIHKRDLTLDDFSVDQMQNRPANLDYLTDLIEAINRMRQLRECVDTEAERKELWYNMIQMLPSSFMQKRTVMMNYEVMANIFRARGNHKLKEWHDFIDAIVSNVPYPWIFTDEGY